MSALLFADICTPKCRTVPSLIADHPPCSITTAKDASTQCHYTCGLAYNSVNITCRRRTEQPTSGASVRHAAAHAQPPCSPAWPPTTQHHASAAVTRHSVLLKEVQMPHCPANFHMCGVVNKQWWRHCKPLEGRHSMGWSAAQAPRPLKISRHLHTTSWQCEADPAGPQYKHSTRTCTLPNMPPHLNLHDPTKPPAVTHYSLHVHA